MNRLPDEVVLQIAHRTANHLSPIETIRPWIEHDSLAMGSVADVLALMKTSRQLNRVAVTVFYQRVRLSSTHSAQLFCRTIFNDPKLGSLVEQLACPDLFASRGSFTDTVATILPHLARLKAVSIPQDTLTGALERCAGPFEKLKSVKLSIFRQPDETPSHIRGPEIPPFTSSIYQYLAGSKFPAVQIVEVLTEFGSWKIELRPGSATEKLILSVTTVTSRGTGEWAAMNLAAIPAHHLTHMKRLKLEGPNLAQGEPFLVSRVPRSNIDDFLNTKARSLEVLNLDWPTTVLLSHLGPNGSLQCLHRLDHLRELNISLNMLYGSGTGLSLVAKYVWMEWMKGNAGDPREELKTLLPPSLKIFRLNENMAHLRKLRKYLGDQGPVRDPTNLTESQERSLVKSHNLSVVTLLCLLQRYWLEPGREMWFKRHPAVEFQSILHNDPLAHRSGINAMLDAQASHEIGGTFYRLLELNEA